jgi:hypothetical protein
MKTSKIVTPLILLAFVLAGCGNTTPAALPTPTPTTPLLILLPTQAPTAQFPTVTPLPLPTPTTSPIVPINAEVIFDNYQLRVGPGRMFAPVSMYDSGERVTLLTRERGDNWVLVQTADNRSGWMNVVGLQFVGDISPLPVMAVTNAQMLHGRVWAVDKTPATKIGVSISRAINDTPDFQDNSPTNANGEWYIYVPLGFTGDWVVGPNSYSPESSAVDSAGNLIGKIPGAQLVTLPQVADFSIEFALEP